MAACLGVPSQPTRLCRRAISLVLWYILWSQGLAVDVQSAVAAWPVKWYLRIAIHGEVREPGVTQLLSFLPDTAAGGLRRRAS